MGEMKVIVIKGQHLNERIHEAYDILLKEYRKEMCSKEKENKK